MKIGKSKFLALKSSADQIRQSTGYGGLQKILSSKSRTESRQGLSNYKAIQDAAMRQFVDIMVEDTDGAFFGNEMAAKIQDLGSGADNTQGAENASILAKFNNNIDLFLDKHKSVEGNIGSKKGCKTSNFVSSTVIAESSNNSSNKPTQGDEAPKGRSKTDPSLVLVNANHLDFSPTTALTAEIEIFANAIPTHEFSRCVPFLDVQFQTATTSVKDDKPNSLSLAKMILGPVSVKGKATNNLLVSAQPEGTPVDVKTSTFGMELFTSPQTLTPLNREQRTVPLLDPFKPLMSIESVDISIVPAAGLIEKKTARMQLTLHDRSRLHEIAELIRPENYGTNELLLEWGWSHPDNSGNNAYGTFLNAMRVKEKFSVYNSTFSLEGDGQVRITLDLFAQGSSDLLLVSILDNETLKEEGKAIEKLSKQIRDTIGETEKVLKRKMIKPVQILSGHLASNTTIFAEDLNALQKQLNAKTQKLKGKESTAVAEIQKSLAKIAERKNAFTTVKSEILDEILKKMMSTVDPFHPNIRSFLDAGTGKEKSKISRYISVGKLFGQFVGRPLLATDKYAEVQMFFYGFSTQSGRNGALAPYTVGEFLINKDEFRSALNHLINSTRESQIPIQTFINYIINTFIKYPDSVLTNVKAKGFINNKLNERGARPAPDVKLQRNKKGNLTKAAQEKLDKHREFMSTFRAPNVSVKFEAVPVSPNSEYAKHFDTDQKTILKVHVFDMNGGRSDAFTQIVGASSNNFETVKDISNSLRKARTSKGKPQSDSLKAHSEQLKSLIHQFEEANPAFVKKINSAGADEYRINVSFHELKRILAQNYPTLVYGSEGSVMTAAQFGSIQDQGFKNLQLYRYGRNPDRSPAGTADNGLPIKIQPTNASITMLGCPLLRYSQHYFVDFGTGTSADDMYYAKTVSHSIRPGSFTTSVQLSTRDADGKFESTLSLLNKASQFIEDAKPDSSDS